MASALRKTMEYLGLAESDDERRHAVDGEEDWDVMDEQHGYHHGGSHAVGHDDAHDEAHGHSAQVTPLHQHRPASLVEAEVHRPAAAPDLRRITTIHPRTYNEAKSIGESFRSGVPVIMNLTDMSDADAKRLVDFSAGLVFGLRGAIERVTAKVFLLSPEHVTVTGEAPAPRAANLFNQS
jgi:cell division inhibitor SepF